MKKPAAKPAPSRPANASERMPPHWDLLYQSLETEMGGVEIYTAALTVVQNGDLAKEWKKYLAQTKRHVEIMRDVCTSTGLDPDHDTPGRQVVRHIGKSLVAAIQMAKGSGDPAAAEIVAAECVTLAETKDHANWSLIEKLAHAGHDAHRDALEKAQEEVEDEEDEHLYHSTGWARELWLQALGMPAQLPPPEEEEDVHSAEEAAAAKKKSVSKRRL